MSDPITVAKPKQNEPPRLVAGAIYHSTQDGMEEYATCMATKKIAGRLYGYLQRVGWKPLELEEGSEESKQWKLHWEPVVPKTRGRPRKVA